MYSNTPCTTAPVEFAAVLWQGIGNIFQRLLNLSRWFLFVPIQHRVRGRGVRLTLDALWLLLRLGKVGIVVHLDIRFN